MSQFCQLLKNGNIVVAVSTIPKIILQCSSSCILLHINSSWATNMKRMRCQTLLSRSKIVVSSWEVDPCEHCHHWHLHRFHYIGNVHKSMRYALKFTIFCDSPWGTLQVADEFTLVRSKAYNSVHYSQYSIQYHIIFNDKLQHLTLCRKKQSNRKWVFN